MPTVGKADAVSGEVVERNHGGFDGGVRVVLEPLLEPLVAALDLVFSAAGGEVESGGVFRPFVVEFVGRYRDENVVLVLPEAIRTSKENLGQFFANGLFAWL